MSETIEIVLKILQIKKLKVKCYVEKQNCTVVRTDRGLQVVYCVVLNQIICLLCFYICHYIFPFHYLDIFFSATLCIYNVNDKYKHTRDRLFGLV